MDLLWLPFSLATIFFCGFAQVFAKETRTNVSSANYMLMLGASMFVFMIAYWFVFRVPGGYESWVWVQAGIAAALSGFAYIVYYESLKHGKVSIVGTISGAYAPWVVFLSLLFLGESLSVAEGAGVALVVTSMLVFTYTPSNGSTRKTELLGIAFAVAALFLWGTSAVVAKGAIREMGDANFIGVFAVICPAIWTVYWLASTKGRFEVPRVGRNMLLLSTTFLAAGGVTLYLAYANGNLSIVSPITNLYPVLTIAVAKVRLKERLTAKQYAALAMLLVAMPLFSL
jgi:drug/metabolite transporter (DMT)-like permease